MATAATKARLKALRRKFGLGEFSGGRKGRKTRRSNKGRKTARRARSLGSSYPRGFGI